MNSTSEITSAIQHVRQWIRIRAGKLQRFQPRAGWSIAYPCSRLEIRAGRINRALEILGVDCTYDEETVPRTGSWESVVRRLAQAHHDQGWDC